MPGIQPADVEELIERGVEAVVLSKGYWERLQVCPRTLDLLVEQNIAVEVLQTEAAVERFNELRERWRPVPLDLLKARQSYPTRLPAWSDISDQFRKRSGDAPEFGGVLAPAI